MSHHPLHPNAHYAETSTQFERKVGVGNLVYSLALGISVPDVSDKAIVNLEVDYARHPDVPPGDILHAKTRMLDKRSRH
jgi:acyl dehydratase